VSADGVRRVQLPLLVLAGAALAALPFLGHARNRLLSGQPVGFGAALALAGPFLGVVFAASCLLLLTPVLRPGSDPARWLGLLGTGLALAAASALAAAAAGNLATASSPSARTSFGAGAWLLAFVLLLLASDTASRLRPSALAGLAAAILVLGPLAVLIMHGDLAPLSLFREYAAQRDVFGAALARHVLLVLGALLPALLIGVPLGVAAQRRAGLRRVAFPVLNLIQTIPSIALFGLLIGPLSELGMVVPGVAGVGVLPAILALVLYSLLPIVRNTVEGLDGVPREIRVAARAMGMSPAQAFWRVDAWLALPVLLSGLRITAVQAIGLAAVSALIGAGGLGAIIFQGLFANALDLIVLGALPVIGLAVAADLLFRLLTAWTRAALGEAA
jgi:osmoprotectant transport system permease protein